MKRGPFYGVGQIVRYNLPMYAASVVALLAVALALAWLPLPRWLAFPMIVFGSAALFWTLASLVVSHWVYDRSKLRHWAWIVALLPSLPSRWASLHAGLDETDGALRRFFGAGEGVVLDLYDPAEMTEPSIRRARRLALDPSAQPADFRRLPLPDASQDAILVVFAAHELRRPEARLALFGEISRSLAAQGRAVLVEHTRDLASFLAFGPGFLHFLPRREWLHVIAASGLQVAEEMAITPFVTALSLEKAP